MKILFLPNWTVINSNIDLPHIQRPDKYIEGQKYWFFKYFAEDTVVDVIDIHADNTFHKIEKKLKFYIWQAFLAYKKQNRYDVIISHGAQSGLVLSLLRTLTFRKYPKHIIFDIGGMNGGRRNILENSLIKFAILSNPYIICHSKVIIDNYRNTFKRLVNRTVFIPFGIDYKEFNPGKGLPEHNYVLSFGYAKRDYDTLIKAWKKVETPNTVLKIIGISGHEEAKGSDRIEFVKKVTIDRLKDEIQSSKFVIIPLPVFNYSYGQMSFLQSMCLGKVVLVSKTPSSVDYLQDHENAILVEPYDITGLKEKIELLLSDEDLRVEVSKKGRQSILETFSEQKMGERISKFVTDILSENLK